MSAAEGFVATVQCNCSAVQCKLHCATAGRGEVEINGCVAGRSKKRGAVNGRFWCLAQMNKSGFDASADHISTGFGQLQSVICSIKQITLKHVC